MKKKISIVVPCYNEEESLPIFYETVNKVTEEMKERVNFEFIFVNDGSKDKTLLELRKLAEKDKRVKYISFSRNFGKEAAMLAGLENATGDYITTMDADLQDPPELLSEMLDVLETGEYDCAATKSTNREGYTFLRKVFTSWFYSIISKISSTEMVPGARDFRLMTRQMVDAVISMQEYNRYSKGLFSFVGFSTKWIEFDIKERVAGNTKWNFWKLFSYALEGIVAFSTTPLVIAALIGIIFCLIAFILIVVIVVKTLVWGDPVSGWPSMVCIMFLVGGVQLFCTGIIGEYLSKTYLETKKRPIYIVKETNETYKKK
ncbi:MAG: glycosyltransferase family 2 protein [Firmicutes bacterium]|nr:glycosyltransferase family 2 protein [Bacillota bacterium]